MSLYKLGILVFIFFLPLIVNGQNTFSSNVQVGCDPLTVNFTYTGPVAATWDWGFENGTPATSTDQNPEVNYYDAGKFYVSLSTDTLPIADIVYEYITINQTPQALFDTITIQYASFTILCRDTSDYDNLDLFVWDFGDGAGPDTNKNVVFTHKYESEGTYTLKHIVKDVSGCVDSLSKTITITHQFIIPNVFTPNGDGINDRFMVLANGLDFFPQIIIYNRWGTIVYKIENVSQIVWDGRTFDGTLVTPGTYFYVITPPANSNYEYIDSKLKGTIQVIYN